MITRFSAILMGILLCVSPLFSQSKSSFQSQPGPIIVCPHGSFDGVHSIRAPREILDRINMKDLDTPCATIEVTYINFPANAEAAFQEAIDIWSYSISSDVTIRVEANWTNLGSNVLGSAGPSFIYRNFANAPDNSYYASALADKIAGTDLNPGDPDIEANFNSNFSWYYGTDGNCPFNQYDLVSVVLHELGHGLGFVSSASYDSGSGSIGYGINNTPLGFDEFILHEQNGTEILSLSEGTSLGSALVSNNLYCGSAAATAENGDVQPKLYAPATYSNGSSISHWDESTFPASNINALMTPQIGPGQAIHNPGPITLGLFEDMGWSICDNGYVEPVACTDWVSPTPSTGYDHFNTEFDGAPCDIGAGCPFNEIQTLQVHAGDAFSVDNFQEGGTYTFSMCNGSGAGNWIADYTIIAPSGTVDAFGAGDGCSISWTASESGTYTIVVNEEDLCGEANSINNGYPALTCVSGTTDCAPPECEVESLVLNGDQVLCPGETTTINIINSPSIPANGGQGIRFVKSTTNGQIYLPNRSLPYTFDNDLNGLLSGNNYDLFEGEYEVYAFIYTDASDFYNTICATSDQALTIDFKSSTDPFCVSDPCDNDTEPPSITCQNITLTLNSNGLATLTAAQIDNGSIDNCTIESLIINKTSFSCTDIGENAVTLTVTDVSGNSSTCTAVVNVVDNISPTITAPENVITQTDILDCLASNVGLGNPVFNDNCNNLTVSNNAPEYFPIGETNVIWTVTDASGNESSDTQLVTVSENDNNSISIVAVGNTTFCEGGFVTLTATVGFENYTWSNGAQTQTIQVNQSGTYNVTAEYGNGCGAAISNDIEVTVLPDSDNDGVCDFEDNCPDDPNKIEPGECGCGTPDTDSDNDGVADCNDDCPLLEFPMGAPCDDGNPATENDTVTDDCQCIGTPISATVEGTVAWDNACGNRAFNLKFYNPETDVLEFEITDVVNADGHFSLPNIDLGTYNVIAKVDGYLAKLIPEFSVSDGINNLEVGVIIPGDFSGDNVISIFDFSVLGTVFGTIIGEDNFNPLVDINCDGVINISDVSMVSGNFGMQGDHIDP